jgi:hypothetical protein
VLLHTFTPASGEGSQAAQDGVLGRRRSISQPDAAGSAEEGAHRDQLPRLLELHHLILAGSGSGACVIHRPFCKARMPARRRRRQAPDTRVAIASQ